MEELKDEKIEVPLDPRLRENPPTPLEQKGFGITNTLSRDEMRDCTERALKKVKEEHSMELSLEKSTCTVSGQEWVLVSFVAPKGTRQRTDEMGLKVWGAFPSQERAKKHASKLNAMEENKYFDIYVLEMYTWAAIPPDPQQIEDQEYHDKKLNKLIWAHKVEKEKAREVFDLRKLKLLEGAEDNLLKAKKAGNNQYQRELIMPTQKMPEFTVISEDGEESNAEIEELPELVQDS